MTLTNEELSDKEKIAFIELQVRIKSFLTPKVREDPSVYYRFLKARDFDVDKAEKMLMKHITWRKINQVDTILEDMKPKEFFYKYTMPSEIGVDKDGDMVVYSPSGKLDTAEILKCTTMNEYMKSWIWFCEKHIDASEKQKGKVGKGSRQTTYILDLDSLTLSNVINKSTAQIWLFITTMFQDNFPERMKAVYAINAPAYYVLVFSILKQVMSSAMVQKIHVLGQSRWKETLLTAIDADVLPAFLGGNRTDPDGNPLCHTVVNHVQHNFSPKFYLSDEDRYFPINSEVVKIVVPSRERKEIFIDVTENGSIIKWEYLVKSKDIGFGLSFQQSEGDNEEEIIPIETYSTPDGTLLGSYKTKHTGKYIVIFDNSHSWILAKEVEYCVSVITSK